MLHSTDKVVDMLLTEMKIRNAKPSGKNCKLNDGDGLYLLVHVNGSKYWQFRYTFAGKSKVLSIGKYPVVSLSEARERKSDAQRLLRDSIDPSAHKQQQKSILAYQHKNTFMAVAKEWHERNTSVWTPRHAFQTWRRLEMHILPDLGRRPVSEIKPLDVLAVLQKVESKGVTDLCVRVLWICSSVFRYAVITGRAEHNPALNLKGALKPYKESHYPSLRAREIPDFLNTMEALDTCDVNKIAFKILLLTALRTGELRHGRWEDIDFHAREWRVPAEKMKMREEHIVPLSSTVMVLLERLRSLTGHSEWLFPNRNQRGKPTMSENTINAMINRMGYKGRVVGHGFRAMFSTILNEHGFNRDAIERQLAHVERNGVRAAYNRAQYLPERRQMMQWWADFIENLGAPSFEQAMLAGSEKVSNIGGPESIRPYSRSSLLNPAHVASMMPS
jgi:integrase